MWHIQRAFTFGLGLLGAMMLAAAVAAAPARESHYLRTVLDRFFDIARLDFGTSSISGLRAVAVVGERLPATLELMAAGAVVAFVVGIPLGALLGRGRALRAAAPLLQLFAAAPVFCAGLGLLWLSAHVPDWSYASQPLAWSVFGEGGRASLMALHALALPGLTVGAAGAAAVQLAVRRAESEAIEEPYRQGLKRLGLSSYEIDRLYLAPQILAGMLASFGEIVLALFSATAVAELLFGWPGAAVLFLRSVALHDWSVTALVLLVFAAISLLADFCGMVAARALGDLP